MSRAIDNTTVSRTPRDKGDSITIKVTLYDNGLWHVSGEPCVDRKEVDRVVGNVIAAKLGSS